jgi:hypothetical protein
MGVISTAALHEPAPTSERSRESHPHIADMVRDDALLLRGSARIARDIEDRKTAGVAKYGTPLQGFNGRNPVMDLYQELLDAANYMRQHMYEEVESGRYGYEHSLWLTKYNNLLELIRFVQADLPSKY